MFEEIFCILKKGWREKEFMGIQTALLGKASLCYLELAASFEFQPWQSASQKLNEKTHPLNAVGPLVVDDFDGAKLELNQLPSTLLCARQQQPRAAHPNIPAAPWAHGAAHAVPAAISGRAISGQQSWALSVCLRHGSKHTPPRDDTTANPNKWSMRLLLPAWRAFS